MNRKRKNHNEIEYDLPDTSNGLPTFWTTLFLILLNLGLATLVLWLGSMLLHGGK